MKALLLPAFGLENLALVDRPEPTPGPRDVLVRIKAASLNYRDVLTVLGNYNPKLKLPVVPCSDGAGEVVAIGGEVTRFKVGDRVMTSFFQRWRSWPVPRDPAVLRATLGGPLDGALTQLAAFPEEGLASTPPHLSDQEAATLPCAALTAWSALIAQGGLQPGDTVVVQGTGGVSLFGLQLAKLAGARVIITSSSDEKLERARALGADELINYTRNKDWSKEVRRLTGGFGADHVIEVGGKESFLESVRAVHPGGIVHVIGVLSGVLAEIPLTMVLMQNIRLQGVLVGPRDELEAMSRAITANRMRPIVDQVVPFTEARRAFEAMQQARHFGKIVVDLS